MRQLKSDHQIFGGSIECLVRFDQRIAKAGDSRLIFAIENELIWIRSPISTDGHRFAAENKFRAAFTKSAPAPQHIIADAAAGGAIPTFHWLNRKTIGEAFT